jgi:hypothetical protein
LSVIPEAAAARVTSRSRARRMPLRIVLAQTMQNGLRRLRRSEGRFAVAALSSGDLTIQMLTSREKDM